MLFCFLFGCLFLFKKKLNLGGAVVFCLGCVFFYCFVLLGFLGGGGLLLFGG